MPLLRLCPSLHETQHPCTSPCSCIISFTYIIIIIYNCIGCVKLLQLRLFLAITGPINSNSFTFDSPKDIAQCAMMSSLHARGELRFGGKGIMATKRSVPSSPASSQSSNSQTAKRPKTEAKEEADDSFRVTFEDQLAMMDVIKEEEENVEEMDTGLSASSQEARWKRPAVKIIQEEKDAIVFQQIDLDHYLGQPLQGMPGAQEGTVPIVRMYGVTNEGHSVLAHVHGFLPHFYVPAPSDTFSDEDCATFHSVLDAAVRGDARGGQGLVKAVLAVEIELKSSMYNFHFNRKHPFLKVTMATPKLLAPAKAPPGTRHSGSTLRTPWLHSI